MNCESEEEVRKRITDDMKQFNKDALANYKEYDTIFQDNLLTPYRNNLIELQKLYEQASQLVNAMNGLWVNDNNYTTPDQLLANSASKNELNLKTDYSDLMLKAKDESTFWALANLRNQKAEQLGQDLSGNNPKYRSNDQLYKEWQTNNAGLQKSSKLQKNILDTNNNFWNAYNQSDEALKRDNLNVTDSYVNKLCGEWVEYNNQYQLALLDPMSENNGTLDYLREQMSNVYDQIAERMQLSVNEIQTIGAQMVDAQNQVYTSLAESIQRTQELYQQSLATGKSYSLGGGVSIDASKGGSGGWSEAEMNEGFNSSGSSSGGKSKSSTRLNIDKMRSDAEAARNAHGDGKIHVSDIGKYSNGIENGPVTYTGLAMLHGTPNNPEFVLNSDQAYTLLRNMATTKLPEMQKVSGGESQSTQYIVQGDIVLENTNNPAQFWDDVSKAMSNRHNVTKNR